MHKLKKLVILLLAGTLLVPTATAQMDDMFDFFFGPAEMVLGTNTVEQGIAIHIDNHKETPHFYAWMHNTTNIPIAPEAGTNLTYTFIHVQESTDTFAYWNGTNFTNDPSFQNMTPVQNTSRGLWKASISPPTDIGYTVIVRGQANASGLGMFEETFNEWVSESENTREETMIEISGLGTSALIELAVWGLLLMYSLWRGWVFPSIAATMPLFHPIFSQAGVFYPINFIAGIFLYVIAIWAQRYSEWFDQKVGV